MFIKHIIRIIKNFLNSNLNIQSDVYGLMEFLIDQVCEEYNLTPYIDKHDLVIETMQKLHPYKGNIREIKSYLTTELIKLDASRSSTLTGIELMKTTPL